MKKLCGTMALVSLGGCFSVGGMIEADTIDFTLGAVLLLALVFAFGVFARRATR